MEEEKKEHSTLSKVLMMVLLVIFVIIAGLIVLGILNSNNVNITDIRCYNSEHFYLRGAYDKDNNETVIHKEGDKLQCNVVKTSECDTDKILIKFEYYDKENNLVQTEESEYAGLKELKVNEKMLVEVKNATKKEVVKLVMNIIER